MPDWSLASLLIWAQKNSLASTWSDVIGLSITIIGFTATLIGVFRSKKAAVLAKQAAIDARDSIRLLDTIVDFSAAIAILEEIKRFHRQNDAWPILPDRYAAIRKHLIQLRSPSVVLSEQQKAAIQNAFVNLVDIEKRVEKSLATKTPLNAARFNAIVSDDIDALLTVLTQLKSERGGPK